MELGSFKKLPIPVSQLPSTKPKLFEVQEQTVSAPSSCLVSPHADTSSDAAVEELAETEDSDFPLSLHLLFFDRPQKNCLAYSFLSWPCYKI